MELYGYFRSSASYRVRIALALKGVDYQPRYVSLLQHEQSSPEYLAVNPQGFVPSLVEGGRTYTQSLAILEYLEETRPEPPLLPRDPAGRARVRALSQIVGCDIHPLNNLRVLKYLKSELCLDERQRNAWYRHWVAEGFRHYEALLRQDGCAGRFSHGETVTLADVCLVPQVFNARRFDCPLEDYPLALAIFEACMELPAFDRTQPRHQPDARE